MESIWAPWILGLSSSKLGAATTTNFGWMFRRAKFTIYCSLCCANGTPVETTPSMNFDFLRKERNQTRVGQLAIASRALVWSSTIMAAKKKCLGLGDKSSAGRE